MRGDGAHEPHGVRQGTSIAAGITAIPSLQRFVAPARPSASSRSLIANGRMRLVRMAAPGSAATTAAVAARSGRTVRTECR
jgi:hypothetical protein